MMKLIKRIYYRLHSSIKCSQVDKKATITYNVKFYNSKIGKYSYVSNDCNIFHTNIGKYSSIALGCNIGGGGHPIHWVSTSPIFTKNNAFTNKYAHFKFEAYKETNIGNDVWIGAGSFVKSGVTISDGAIVGMGSVVTHDIPPYEIWAGNPARHIGTI